MVLKLDVINEDVGKSGQPEIEYSILNTQNGVVVAVVVPINESGQKLAAELVCAVNAHDDLATVAQLGTKMRDAQRTYFKTRNKDNLIASKQAEAAFDRALLEAIEKLRHVPPPGTTPMTREEKHEEAGDRG